VSAPTGTRHPEHAPDTTLLVPDPAECVPAFPSTADTVPAGSYDGGAPVRPRTGDLGDVPPELDSALSVLRRGLAASPELRTGLWLTVLLALVGAVGRVVTPILVQQVIDDGLDGDGATFDGTFVAQRCAVGAAVVVVVYLASRAAYRRVIRAAEETLRNLRVRVFAHLHRLPLADHTESTRGTLVARVTLDVDVMAQFVEWGGLIWITATSLALGTTVIMLVYSWQLALVVLLVVAPIVLVLRALQRRLLVAYDDLRTRISDTVTEVSESIMGAAVTRAYGLEDRTRTRIGDAIERQYRAQVRTHRYGSLIFPVSDLFGGLATAAVVVVGTQWGDGWGLTAGRLVAFLFLVALFLEPVQQLTEVLDQTQTAVAGWRKVLAVLDTPIDVVEPDPGRPLPTGPVGVSVRGVSFAYRDGVPVLQDVGVEIAPGSRVAVVGETGSGKTTFAKLLCRLADPTAGEILVAGVPLREVAPVARRAAIRMVPQDGFLFDTTIRENVRSGRPDASDADVADAVAALGLEEWVDRLPAGLDTPVGERGESLSVGERQLVALVRAQLSSPGLLILDEATSSVDAETERALSDALVRLSEGRTTVSIAHRLSTAEAADVVLVFDRGRLVEHGHHAALVGAGGTYAALHASWIGNTRATR
jgi:ATP-binding cassette, subfamily B, bacterial